MRKGPAPQFFKPLVTPPGVQEIVYTSGPLALKAWAAFPAGASQDADLAAREVQRESRLNIVRMRGDHFTSLAPSVTAFIETLETDA